MKRYMWIVAAAIALIATVLIPVGLRYSSRSSDDVGSITAEAVSSAPDGADSAAMDADATGTQQVDTATEGEAAATKGASGAAQQNNAAASDSSSTAAQPQNSPVSSAKPTAPRPGASHPSASVPNSSVSSSPKPQSSGSDANAASFVDQVLQLVNEERTKAGLKPLTLSRPAAAAAQTRAREIETSFSHTRPNGSSFSTALTEQGAGYRRAGENIAWGQRTPAQVMEGWMNSPGHRANILNADFTSIGVGYYRNAAGNSYWTQLFIG